MVTPSEARRQLRAPKQERSQRTLDRILEASNALVEQRDFAEISVQEIAAAARTSVSSFYARFPDKGALLYALLDRFAEEMRGLVATFEEPGRFDGRPLEVFVRSVVEGYMDVWEKRRGLIQTVTAAERSDPVLFERRNALDTEVALRFRDKCLELYPEVRESGFGEAFEVALPSLAAAIRASVDRPDLFAERSVVDRNRWVAELTKLALRYLAIDDA